MGQAAQLHRRRVRALVALRLSSTIARYSSSASSRRPRLYSAACLAVCTSTSVAVSPGSISRTAADNSEFTRA